MIPATMAIFVATAATDMPRSFDGLADAARTGVGARSEGRCAPRPFRERSHAKHERRSCDGDHGPVLKRSSERRRARLEWIRRACALARVSPSSSRSAISWSAISKAGHERARLHALREFNRRGAIVITMACKGVDLLREPIVIKGDFTGVPLRSK